MTKKTVYVVVEDGIVVDAYATDDIDVVVCDLDCPDGDMKEEIQRFVAQLPDFAHEVEIL